MLTISIKQSIKDFASVFKFPAGLELSSRFLQSGPRLALNLQFDASYKESPDFLGFIAPRLLFLVLLPLAHLLRLCLADCDAPASAGRQPPDTPLSLLPPAHLALAKGIEGGAVPSVPPPVLAKVRVALLLRARILVTRIVWGPECSLPRATSGLALKTLPPALLLFPTVSRTLPPALLQLLFCFSRFVSRYSVFYHFWTIIT